MNAALQMLPARDDRLVETYSYGYPHKSLYQTLETPVPLAPLWQSEPRDALALYLHVPFCEMRCGFCNLFTFAQPREEIVGHYVEQLAVQLNVVQSFGTARFAECALGGGTPTILSITQLEIVLAAVERMMGASIKSVPTSIETSPATATPDRLALLRDFGVRRVSIGIQATTDGALSALGRPGSRNAALSALDRLLDFGFPVVNADLIYGFQGQSLQEWRDAVKTIAAQRPQEAFLYPLYVRPGTGLDRRGGAAERRHDLYRIGRDVLLEAGYLQQSHRNFILPAVSATSIRRCQRDGMIGIGCGARSYTDRLHYSTPFAVAKDSVATIVDEWLASDEGAFAFATHGVRLDDDERRRRHVILSLLDGDGLDDAEYERRFGETPEARFQQLHSFADDGWLQQSTFGWKLTKLGLERSDELGLAFYSDASRRALAKFVQRTT